MTYKLKITIAVTALLLVTAALLVVVYPMLNRQNFALAAELELRKEEHQNLESERQSIVKGQDDLKRLENKLVQPENFFSHDQTLVSEVRKLESISTDYNLDLTLKVSGTASSAVAVPKTSSGLISVPFSMMLEGQFTNMVRFLDAFEQLPFVSHIQAMQVNSISDGPGLPLRTEAKLNGFFYLRK